ncbi:MAG: GntR family transcriptional regulator [Flexilinea sp.]
MLTIDKNSQTPIYTQLEELIKGQISAGELVPGSKVLSETQLASRYNISRVTVRKALSNLVNEKYLVRKQGKGTFVRNFQFNENLKSVSFTQTCLQLGFTPSNKIINCSMIPATEKDITFLSIPESSEVAFMERLRYADGIPVRLERNYYASPYQSIIEEDLEHLSVNKVLVQKFGLYDFDARISIEIAYANPRDAALLGVKKKSPLLLVNGVFMDKKGAPIYRTEMLHLPDRCILEI